MSQVQLHIGLYAKSSYRGFLVAPSDSVRTRTAALPASVACGLGQLKVALRPRLPSSQTGASRIEWKFDFSCREWMDCLVECEQLGSAGSLWCNMIYMFSALWGPCLLYTSDAADE